MWLTERKRLVLGILGAALAVVVLGFTARPTYHKLKAWRARSLAAESARLLTQGKLAQAQLKAQAACLMSPQEAGALRAAARIQAALGNPNATAFWQALIALGKASPGDRREYIELCLRFGLLTQAQAELGRISLEAPADPVTLWLLSQLSFAKGDFDQSVDFAAQASAKDPKNQRYLLFLSAMRYDAADKAAREPARKSLWTIAHRADPIALEAVSFLAERQDLSPDELRELIRVLQTQSSPETAQRLLALGLKLRLDPSRKAALLDEAAVAYRSGPMDQLNQFAAWLNQRREFARTLAVLPYEQALKRRDSFIIHLDAVAGLDHWTEVAQILGRDGLPLQDSILEAFRARAALKLQQTDQAAFHWRRAVQAARDDVEQLEFVAQYAEKNDQYSDAIRAYRAVLQAEPSRLPAYLSLSRILQQHGSTIDLLELMGQMARVWPQNPTFKNDLAYLNLLLNKEVASSRKTAEELVRQFPQLLPIRCTLALACLRAKEPALALGLLSDSNVDWRQALPADRAVYIGVLAANGKLKEAQALANDLPIAALRKEELDLVRAAGPRS